VEEDALDTIKKQLCTLDESMIALDCAAAEFYVKM
jgi:hypothetical protein